MKKIVMAIAASAFMVAFSNSASAAVPDDTNAELRQRHQALAENINNPDGALRSCAEKASRILNSLDYQARTQRDPGAWAAIDQAMTDYGTCLQSAASGAASAHPSVPKNVNAALQSRHREIAQYINSPDGVLRACAEKASGVLNSLDWEARQAKNPDAWATIENTMAIFRQCLKDNPSSRGVDCIRKRECGNTSRSGSLGNQNSNQNWEDGCVIYYSCRKVPSPHFREPGVEYKPWW